MSPSIANSLRESRGRLERFSGRARKRLVRRSTLAARSASIPGILEALDAGDLIGTDAWTVGNAHFSDTGVAILPIGPPGAPARLIVKFAESNPAAAALHAQHDRLATLHADSRLSGWGTIMPIVLKHGVIDGIPYSVETALPGIPARLLLHDAVLRRWLLPAAAEAIAELHARTGAPAHIDDAVLERWVGDPVRAIVGAVKSTGDGVRELQTALEALDHELRRRLGGHEAPVGWIHGDFWPGNILVEPGGGKITGIIDWSLASDGQPPVHDAIHLILQTRRLVSGRELGEVVSGLLDGDPLETAEASALESAGFGPSTWQRDSRDLLLLAWLRFVGHVAPIQGPHRGWIRRNIATVLQDERRRLRSRSAR